jgi:predicted hydrocarbon binding protein
MPPPDPTSPAAALDRLFDPRAFRTDAAAGLVTDPAGSRVIYAPHEFTRALHHILLKEKSGVWRDALARTGRACGRDLALGLDRESTRLGLPALAELPLETCLGFLERSFAAHGWGVLKVDLADAPDHGLVTAHLTHSFFAEVLADTNDFADPFPAGLLQGFFEFISGEELGCIEIACVRRGAPRCTFVITATERLATVAPFLGRDTAEAILARLKA